MSAHTGWCAGGHRCNLGEHRADPITVRVPGAGSLVLTRIRSTTGRDFAEVSLNLALPGDEPAARQRLVALLTDLRALLADSSRAPLTGRGTTTPTPTRREAR